MGTDARILARRIPVSVFGPDRLESVPLAALKTQEKLYKVTRSDLVELEALAAKRLKYFAKVRPGDMLSEMCRSITVKSGPSSAS